MTASPFEEFRREFERAGKQLKREMESARDQIEHEMRRARQEFEAAFKELATAIEKGRAEIEEQLQHSGARQTDSPEMRPAPKKKAGKWKKRAAKAKRGRKAG